MKSSNHNAPYCLTSSPKTHCGSKHPNRNTSGPDCTVFDYRHYKNVLSQSLVTLVLVSILFFSSCSQQASESKKTDTGGQQTVSWNGYTIEVFPTAEEQFRYARSWFSDPSEKQAALEMLIETFPKARSVRGQAELELAYLTLGADYRFADPAACTRAINRYKQIVTDYSALAPICAKAYWYMGWIYADLLKDSQRGIENFQIVVDRYSTVTLILEPPVPWVSLVLEDTNSQGTKWYSKPTYSWGSIALLEIIRNSREVKDKLQAFETLLTYYRTSLSTGYALCHLLNHKPVVTAAAKPARQYLQDLRPNHPLSENIREALQTIETVHAISVNNQGNR